ncbi:MAG: glycoside hydrolase family 2 [Bacteroidetes bacterium]|nr:glycoside hydrolase family 2 [Bacteroidota bacterium]
MFKYGYRLFSSFLLIIFFLTASFNYAKDKTNYKMKLKNNWFIQSSEKIKETGEQISTPAFNTNGWYHAEVPTTVLAALVKNKVYNDIFFDKNLDKISPEPFKKSWWYRTEFEIPKNKNINTAKLFFNGINYRANIWLNGIQVAKSDSVEGCFRRFEINISKAAKFGSKNILAVEIIPPVKGDPTMGFVDWNPEPADRNMGLWRPVSLELSGDVSINFPFVKTDVDTVTLKKAELTITSEIQNNSDKKVNGIIEGKIGSINFSKQVSLEPNESKLISFSPKEFSQFIIHNPRLWWTHDFGKPELYDLTLTFKIKNEISDEKNLKFGIRQVSDYFTSDGFRGFKLNGKKILIRGGGWTDNMLLNNSYKNLVAQIDYAKQMNLNTIRMEGFWGEGEDIYNLCDEKGILIMVGWSAQWEWEGVLGKPADQFGGIKSSEDMQLIAQSWKDQIKWLRNHPSIFLWLYGSDKLPRPELEKKYLAILSNDDPTRPYVASAAEHKSELTGKTAVKMRGPYDYVPPDYWYIDKKDGGAFGFNTETGPGPQVPPVSSLEKMIPKDSLWPINSEWIYHCSRFRFENLTTYNEAIDRRLGAPSSLEDYERKAQFTNYEAMRAMYEAFDANKFNSTGVIQWMYNSAWPKLWWQLYDYYLMPTGAFYGARKAGEPIHIQYNYGTNGIDVINNTLNEYKDLKAEIKVLNLDLSNKFSKNIFFELAANISKQVVQLPNISGLSKTYFVDLKLYDKNKIVSNNFYCLSPQADDLDTAKTNGFVTPEKGFANLTELNNLPKTRLEVKNEFTNKEDKDYFTINLKNPTDKLAFQIEIMIDKGKNGEPVLPIFLDDNYFSLLPGESRIIRGYVYKEDLDGKKPSIKISGWNVE